MNREQLKLLYQKLAPRLRLLLLTLAALGGFLFAVFLFRQIFSWQISYFRNLATLRSPLPVAEERNTAETEPGTDAGEEKESGSMGSYTAQGDARRIWNWPDDLALRKKALAEFSRAQKWDAALNIGANLSRDVFFQDEVFQLVERSYLAHAGKAVAEEKEEMRRQNSRITLFDQAAFLVNLRLRLHDDVKVSSITGIMFESYLPAIPDRFAVWLALSPEPAKRQTPLPYGNDSETIFRTLIENDLNSMGRYMKTRWDLFAAELAKKPELAAALNAVSATEQQQELMQDFSSRNRPIIKAEEYRSLPRVWSWFFGKAAINAFGPGTDYEKLKKVFSGNLSGQEWMDALGRGVRLSPAVRSFFRSRPQWLGAMNARDYEAALDLFRRNAAEIIPGGGDSALESGLEKMAELEKSLMREYFSDQMWEDAVRRKTETRASAELATQDFIDIVKTLLKQVPETKADDERKKAFLALCLLNRGRNGRSVYLLADTTNESLIKHHIPAEELNNEQ